MQSTLFAKRALLTNPVRTSNLPRQNKERSRCSRITPGRLRCQSWKRLRVPSRLKCVRNRRTKMNVARSPDSSTVDTSSQGVSSSLKNTRQDRVAKFEKLRSSESPLLTSNFKPTHKTSDLRTLSGGPKYTLDGDEVRLAGRLISIEYNKDSTRMLLLDQAGYLNVCLEKDEMVKEFIDKGDLIGVVGTLQKSDNLELELFAKSVCLLSKSIEPLPEQFAQLTDSENRSQQRYIDLIMHPQTREVFQTRMKVKSAIRSFLEHRGCIEIDTPVLYSASGGADADPFFTRHAASHRSLTLRISPELHLKRMMVGGFERVFELGRIFRNEESSTRHNPEFTTVEFYEAYTDYNTLMDVTEDLIRSCVLKVHDESSVEYGGRRLDFGSPFRRVSMAEAVAEVCGVEVLSYASLSGAKETVLRALKDHEEFHAFKGKLQLAPSLGHLLNEVFEAVVEPQLWQPTIVMDYPTVISPYARPHESHSKIAQRFEIFVAGRELANGSAEITDAIALKQRLESRYQCHHNGTNSVTYSEVDYDFLKAMELGLPPSAGTAMGVDRLIMLLTNTSSIKDVIPFPLTE